MHKIIFISGPTASGKSEFVHKIIDKYFYKASILSVDSIQIYKMLTIGSAKPAKYIQEKYRYNLIDFVDPRVNFSVSDYINNCANVIPNMEGIIFAVGGTGLYFDGLKYGLFYEEDDGGVCRQKLYNDYQKHGHDYMLGILKDIDIASYNTVDLQNIRRVIRAIEVYYKTGNKFSDMKKLRKQSIPIQYLHYNIDKDRNTLYNDINLRVDNMLASGLIDEVASIIDYGVKIENTSLQAIGYKECYDYIVGKNISYNELSYNIKINTRHFAKRQISWFKRYDDIVQIQTDNDNSIKKMLEEINTFYNI